MQDVPTVYVKSETEKSLSETEKCERDVNIFQVFMLFGDSTSHGEDGRKA